MREKLEKIINLIGFTFIVFLYFHVFKFNTAIDRNIFFIPSFFCFLFLLKTNANLIQSGLIKIKASFSNSIKKIKFISFLSTLGVFLFVLTSILNYLFEFRIDFYLSQKKLILLNIYFLVSILIYFFKKTSNKIDKIKTWQILSILAITILGGYLRIKNLGQFDIYHDEYFYFSSVKSYLYDGSVKLWDYFQNQPGTRNYYSFITVLTANFINLTKFDEFHLRLPFAIIGTLSIPMTFLLSYVLFKNYFISFTASYLLVFSDIHIYLSRFLRQYSFFIFFVQIIALIMILGVKKVQKTNKTSWFYLLSPIILIIFNFLEISAFAVAILPAYFIYALILLNHVKHNKKIIFISASILILSLDIFSNFKIINIASIFKNNLIIGYSPIRTGDYLKWLFIDFKWQTPSMIVLTIISTALFIRNKEIDKILISIGFFYLPLFFLIFNLYHSHDFRYLSFLLPFLFIIIAQMLDKIRINKMALIVILTLVLIKPSFPGLGESKIFSKAQADWRTTEGGRIHPRAVAPKYKETYDLLNKERDTLDVEDLNILIIDGRQYLPIYKNANYFLISSYMGKPKDMEYGEEIDFEDFFAKENIMVIGAYLHWLPEKWFNEVVDNYEQKNCAFYFAYSAMYENKNTCWPNILIKKSF